MATDPVSLRKTAAADRFAAAAVVGLVATIGLLTWASNRQPGAASVPVEATIRWIGPSNSRTAYSRGAPQLNLEVETADGRYLRLAGDSRLIWNCRVDGKIHLLRSRTNSGAPSHSLAPRPCTT